MGRVLHWLQTSPWHQLFAVSCISRVVLVLWIWFCATIMMPYDESPVLHDVDLRAESTLHGTRQAPVIVPLWHWDAVHFRHIADYGYTHESTFAFYPLAPILMRVVFKLVPSAPFVAFTTLQIVFFSASVVFMRHLLKLIVDTRADALVATAVGTSASPAIGAGLLFYLASPASIFTVVSYTEPVFCFLTLGGLCLLHSGAASIGILWLTLATAARSNGILACPFLLLDSACFFLGGGHVPLGHEGHGHRRWKNVAWSTGFSVFVRMVGSVIVLAPYVAMNVIPFRSFCRVVKQHPVSAAASEWIDAVSRPTNGKATDGPRPIWARVVLSLLDGALPSDVVSRRAEVAYAFPADHACPSSWLGMYNHIQVHYWQLGWFKHYEFRNIHNFAIAGAAYVAVAIAVRKALQKTDWTTITAFVRGWICSPHTIWLLVMVFLAGTRMHIQVTTRFIFVSPAFYALIGAVAVDSRKYWRFLLTYIGVYVILSPVLFGTFYPWT